MTKRRPPKEPAPPAAPDNWELMARAQRRDAIFWLTAMTFPVTETNIHAIICAHYHETINDWINDPAVAAGFRVGQSFETIAAAIEAAGGPDMRPPGFTESP